MDDVSVVSEHVDFLDAGDVVHHQFLEGCLEFLVVGGRRPMDDFPLPTRGTFPANSDILAHLLQLGRAFRIHFYFY